MTELTNVAIPVHNKELTYTNNEELTSDYAIENIMKTKILNLFPYSFFLA